MIILNFSHPLSNDQRTRIDELAHTPISEVRDIPVQIKQDQPLREQIVEIVNTLGMSNNDWQTRSFLINPPGYAPAAFVLLAELHGRMGHFPSLLRLRPVDGAVTTYEPAEIINLQSVRDASRVRRLS